MRLADRGASRGIAHLSLRTNTTLHKAAGNGRARQTLDAAPTIEGLLTHDSDINLQSSDSLAPISAGRILWGLFICEISFPFLPFHVSSRSQSCSLSSFCCGLEASRNHDSSKQNPTTEKGITTSRTRNDISTLIPKSNIENEPHISK